MGKIGKIITGNTPSKKNPEYYGTDYPFFKPTDLEAGFYTNKAQDNLSEKGYEISRKLPQKSILVTCIGSIGKTGFTRVEGTCNQQINAIVPNDNICNEFIYYMILTDFVQTELINNSSATTIAILNKSKFEQILVPLPPLSEQKAIVERIESIFEVLEDIETMINI